MVEHDLVVRIRAALEHEPAVNVRAGNIEVTAGEDAVILDGEVEAIGAKRMARRIAELHTPRVVDRIRIRPTEPREDGAVKDALALAFRSDRVFSNCRIGIAWNGQHELISDSARPDVPCYLDLTVEGGVVTLRGTVWSLSHRRLAEVLAWWSPGTRDVVNGLEVTPAEQDNDAEINDAVNLVLDKDPLVHNGQIHASTDHGVVTLEGLVREPQERQMAENDVWYLSGVRGVVNQIHVGG